MATEMDILTGELLRRLRRFCFPHGEQGAAGIRGVRTTQVGEIRASAGARWTPFTATELVDATTSCFRWEARVGGKLAPVRVIDEYSEGHGGLDVTLAGLVPIQKVRGPEVDRGELQRYLASVMLCPPMLLHHRGLGWKAIAADRLELRDTQDTTGTAVELLIAADGRPVACFALRPRMEGKRIIITPWSGTCTEFVEFEGFRAGRRLEVRWQLEDGEFVYFRTEVTGMTAIR